MRARNRVVINGADRWSVIPVGFVSRSRMSEELSRCSWNWCQGGSPTGPTWTRARAERTRRKRWRRRCVAMALWWYRRCRTKNATDANWSDRAAATQRRRPLSQRRELQWWPTLQLCRDHTGRSLQTSIGTASRSTAHSTKYDKR